ncbi:MAG: tetratricopeptide repeat protein [Myxococcota bacterium]
MGRLGEAESAVRPIETVLERLAAGDRAGAEHLLTPMVTQREAPAEAFLYLGVIRRDDGHREAAIALFERGLGAHPGSGALRCEAAITHAWQGRHDAALAHYALALADSPDLACALQGRARVLLWSGEHTLAQHAYERMLRDDPNSLSALEGLGHVFLAQERRRNAIATFERMLRLAPAHPSAAEGLRSARKIRPWRLTLSGGGSRVPEQQPAFTGRVRIDYAPSAALRFAAHYAAEMPVLGNGGDPLLPAMSAGLGVALRPSLRTSIELEYTLLDQHETTHRVGVRTSLRVTPVWTVMAGLRGGIDHRRRAEAFVDGGVQRNFGVHWIMLRVFGFGSARERLLSGALSGSLIFGPIQLGATAFTGRDLRAVWLGGSGGLRLALGACVTVGAEYELTWRTGMVHRATVTLQVQR